MIYFDILKKIKPFYWEIYNMSESILDKVIDSQKNAATLAFNPQEILNVLLKDLKEREIEVLTLRYGLKDNLKRTLEEIGAKFGVTRERIRQIENAALKKIKRLDNLEKEIKSLEILVGQVLENYGGIMREESLIKKVLAVPGHSETNFSATQFILSKLLAAKLHLLEEDKDFHQVWKLPTVSFSQIKDIIEAIKNLITKVNRPLTAKEVMELVQKENLHQSWPIELDEQVIHSLLEISKELATNPFNEWGLKNWEAIALKRMSDKIFLVLQKEGQPLHFTAIAQKINDIGFDHKKANPATIHNELILDKKYVLVGRGIYALGEWGFKPGVVADVIAQVLQEAGQPLTRQEIIAKVSALRMVKQSTIVLALMNKKRFQKIAGNKYVLTEDQTKTENLKN